MVFCIFSAVYFLLLCFAVKFCSSIAVETISFGQSLSGSQTIVSQDGTFELGFFSTGKSNNTYVGIWYRDFAEKTTVWVANREKPISNTSRSSKLEISEDGNLVLRDESENLWSTNLVLSQPSSIEAVLLNTGNFVLRESSEPSTIFWQSFDYPTDTWLPEGKLGLRILPTSSWERQRLISWKNSEDPSPGIYSFVMDKDTSGGQLFLEWNMSERYNSTGTWTGEVFASVPEFSYTSKFTLVSTPNETYYTYSLFNKIILSRLVMDVSGQLKQLTALLCHQTWSETFSLPREQSNVYAYCGDFSYSSSSSPSSCTCLQGFVPFSNENDRINGGMRGCERKAPLLCENDTSPKGKKHGFLRISNLNPPDNSEEQQLTVEECKSACLENCFCIAYANVGSLCSMWSGALLNLKQVSDVVNNRQDLYVKVANSELQDDSGDKKRLMVIVAVVVSLVGPALGGLLIFGARKIKRRGHGKKDSSQDLLSFDFSSSNHAIDNQVKNVNNAREGSKNDFDLPLFSYASVSAATSNFSAGNKLGEGGFGPVYKGKTLKGEEIAVKRLSTRSGQGLQEFRNEILLIAKLQHRNLVRLLGCCIEQDENILVYEYMPNKSLDFFLFDPKKQVSLEWETRICIIEGIAQGLLYLHQYSRLRIIHRDLKASNILLDSEMNPKISDFGMARIFGGNNSEANTKRIVGTYGYMAPEYALDGIFSIKSDVFSFGVLVLEIVSGKKNTGFYNSNALNLIGHAWDLWIHNRALELLDPSLGSPPAVAVLRCINIGLLCVQENPNDRPTMSNVVSMLCNEVVALPPPKQPAFVARRNVIKANSTSSNAQSVSVNGLTFSSLEPR
ncbi:G-type lectin S-receptor-like serine/threonine-protein kinase At4g27290 [Coffea arabica]|uniref:Receptor-like serine/threonine-protein kinase n=1 Tax=Coffea arabica TaxID=13443 RepID=A0A6P6TWN4_COFAR